MTTTQLPQCLTCAHCEYSKSRQWVCSAFPDGIPEAILHGRVIHTEAYPGDRGIRYRSVLQPKKHFIRPGDKVPPYAVVKRGKNGGLYYETRPRR